MTRADVEAVAEELDDATDAEEMRQLRDRRDARRRRRNAGKDIERTTFGRASNHMPKGATR